MATHKIVFADNNLDFLKTRKQFLEQKGLEIIEATTLEEVKLALAREDIDLAILDIRLCDDDDDKDRSGLQLAADPSFIQIPKIILTAYPTVEGMYDAFVDHDGNLPRVVEFVTKQDGPGALLAAISRVLSMKISLHLAPQDDAAKSKERNNNKVFIIHGHDEAARERVARFIERLGLEAIILQERPNEGLSILQKIERHCAVNFAIAIFTPDDFGGAKKASNHVYDRARQNVIFELGYFIGKLGAKKVCALIKGTPEIPSDYRGIAYIEMDSNDGWKIPLATELRFAGLPIDLNKI